MSRIFRPSNLNVRTTNGNGGQVGAAKSYFCWSYELGSSTAPFSYGTGAIGLNELSENLISAVPNRGDINHKGNFWCCAPDGKKWFSAPNTYHICIGYGGRGNIQAGLPVGLLWNTVGYLGVGNGSSGWTSGDNAFHQTASACRTYASYNNGNYWTTQSYNDWHFYTVNINGGGGTSISQDNTYCWCGSWYYNNQ